MNNVSLNNLFPNFTINKKPKITEQKQYPSVSFNGLQKDTFVRSSSTNPLAQTAATKKVFDEKYATKLYDQAYEETMALMPPTTKELNIEKPTFVFNDDEDESSTIASYNFSDNQVEFSKKAMQQDFYIKYIKYENEKIPINIVMEEDIKDDNPEQNFEFVKLNDEEKEIYIKSCFAHELRHCVQNHLLFSCDKLKDEARQVYDAKLAEKTESIISVIDESIKLYQELLQSGVYIIEGEKVTDKLRELKLDKQKHENPYYKRYEPAKILDENTLLETSISSTDNKPLYFSTKEHLLKGLQQQSENEENNSGNYDIYLSYPHEIDAYNFQAKYLAKCAPIKENKKINDLCVCTMLKYQDGLDNLEKYGYKPLVKES